MVIEQKIEESMDLLEQILHPRNFDRVKQGNLGRDAFLYIQDESISNIPQGPKLHISICGSAGDDGFTIDSLDQFQKPAYLFGRILGRTAKLFIPALKEQLNIEGIVFASGGCQKVPDWVTKGIRNEYDEAFLVAIIQHTERMTGKVFDKRLSPDPRDGKVLTLEQYSAVLGTSMDVTLRSPLVGSSDIGYFIHGGPGSLIEIGSEIDQSSIAACWNIGGERGVVKNIVDTLRCIYRNNDFVFFKNSDPYLLVKRSIIEYFAKQEKLWNIVEGKVSTDLCSVILYRVECTDGKERYFINVRECGLPITYYHRRWGESEGDKHIDKKVYHPLIQYIFNKTDKEAIAALLKDKIPDYKEEKRLKGAIHNERGLWIRYRSSEKEIAKELMENLPNLANAELFYKHRFDKNLRSISSS